MSVEAVGVVGGGIMGEDADAALARLAFGPQLEDLPERDLVVEAVVEETGRGLYSYAT